MDWVADWFGSYIIKDHPGREAMREMAKADPADRGAPNQALARAPNDHIFAHRA